MAADQFANLLWQDGITDERDRQRYLRCLEGLRDLRGVDGDAIVGVARKGTAGSPDLYVFDASAVYVVNERGLFSKRIDAEFVAPLREVAEIVGTEEGFKGRDVTITAMDAVRRPLFKIVWGRGGPDWVEGVIQRQRQRMFEVFVEALQARDRMYGALPDH